MRFACGVISCCMEKKCLALRQAMAFPNSVVSAVVACKNGVKRTHIIDARIDGGLLLELYSRDGVGTMISTDFYEGIRGAQPSDLDNIMVRPSEPCSGVPWTALSAEAGTSASDRGEAFHASFLVKFCVLTVKAACDI